MSMWRSIYESVAGTSHAASGIPCQDSCRVVVVDTSDAPTLIIACSDGAGSATHSHLGSQLACDTIVEVASQHLAQGQWKVGRDEVITLYNDTRQRILSEALDLGVASREMACTLLVAILRENEAVFAQIGDGAIVVDAGAEYRPVFWPQSGEYANTTNFLTANNFADVLEFNHSQEQINDVAVFSDGLERLILRFSERNVHAPFLRPMFEAVRNTEDSELLFAGLRRFLNSSAVNERTDDDKTLILASRMVGSPHAVHQ